MRKVIVTRAFEHYPRDRHFSSGIDTGDFALFSGVTGAHADGSVAEDPQRQCRDAFWFLFEDFLPTGCRAEDLVDLMTFHEVPERHLSPFVTAMDEDVVERIQRGRQWASWMPITAGALIEIPGIARRP
jgi:hypothetical protein